MAIAAQPAVGDAGSDWIGEPLVLGQHVGVRGFGLLHELRIDRFRVCCAGVCCMTR